MNLLYIKNKYNQIYNGLTQEDNKFKIYFKIIVSITFILMFTLINYLLIPKDKWNLPASITEGKSGDNYSIFTIFYYVCATWFTIGYGDITPGCNLGRLLSIIKMFTAFGIVMA